MRTTTEIRAITPAEVLREKVLQEVARRGLSLRQEITPVQRGDIATATAISGYLVRRILRDEKQAMAAAEAAKAEEAAEAKWRALSADEDVLVALACARKANAEKEARLFDLTSSLETTLLGEPEASLTGTLEARIDRLVGRLRAGRNGALIALDRNQQVLQHHSKDLDAVLSQAGVPEEDNNGPLLLTDRIQRLCQERDTARKDRALEHEQARIRTAAIQRDAQERAAAIETTLDAAGVPRLDADGAPLYPVERIQRLAQWHTDARADAESYGAKYAEARTALAAQAKSTASLEDLNRENDRLHADNAAYQQEVANLRSESAVLRQERDTLRACIHNAQAELVARGAPQWIALARVDELPKQLEWLCFECLRLARDLQDTHHRLRQCTPKNLAETAAHLQECLARVREQGRYCPHCGTTGNEPRDPLAALRAIERIASLQATPVEDADGFRTEHDDDACWLCGAGTCEVYAWEGVLQEMEAEVTALKNMTHEQATVID